MSEKSNLMLIMIGSNKKPLAIYTPFTGEFVNTCETTLTQIIPNSSASINCGDNLIYYINENNITYLIMTNNKYPRETAIGCMESIKNEFKDILAEKNLSNINEYELTSEFSEKLKMKYELFDQNPNISKENLENNIKIELNKVQNDEDDKENEQLNIKEEKKKSDDMGRESQRYKSGAIKVKTMPCKKKVCIGIGIILILLIIAYIAISIYCHSFNFKCSKK
jgi:hypothetical protein